MRAGSGKTLAYLLPLVQAMREEEAAAADACTRRNAPRALVLVPTAELAAQVTDLACTCLELLAGVVRP
jgi:ATP-dependent RNA helicase DDX18/HAS1